jgi:hypothetical protein
MTVKFSTFYPSIDQDGVLGTAIPAEVSMWISGPSAADIPYDNAGTTITTPVELGYSLYAGTGQITDGTIITTYTVDDGNVNGFNSSSGPQTITTTNGSALLTINSLSTESAIITISMTRNGATKTLTLNLYKVRAPLDVEDGGGTSGVPSSQSSGFTNISSNFATAVQISSVLSYTIPAGKSTIRVTLALAPKWYPANAKPDNDGPWNVEYQIQRNTGVWTTVATMNSAPDPFMSDWELFKRTIAGAMNGTFDDTGLTAGNTYEYRILARVSSGNTAGGENGMTHTGQWTVVSP